MRPSVSFAVALIAASSAAIAQDAAPKPGSKPAAAQAAAPAQPAAPVPAPKTATRRGEKPAPPAPVAPVALAPAAPAPAPATPAPEAATPPKRGLFQRMFGKRPEATPAPATPAPATPAATPKPRLKTRTTPSKPAEPEAEKPAEGTEEKSAEKSAEKPAATAEESAPASATLVKKTSSGRDKKGATPAAAEKSAEAPKTPEQLALEKATESGDSDAIEKAKYDEVRSRAVQDEKIKELKEKADAATTDEEGRKALRTYNKALFQKMRSLDGSIRDRVDRMEEAVLKRLEAGQ